MEGKTSTMIKSTVHMYTLMTEYHFIFMFVILKNVFLTMLYLN